MPHTVYHCTKIYENVIFYKETESLYLNIVNSNTVYTYNIHSIEQTWRIFETYS